MSDCATSGMRFETEAALAPEAAFDGGRITSDGGLVILWTFARCPYYVETMTVLKFRVDPT